MSIFRNNVLAGQIAIVTGGGTGICKGIARGFLAHGAAVCITSRKQEVIDQTADELAKETGGQVLAVSSDVRDPEAAQRVVMGDTAERDVVAHVAALDRTAHDLHDYVQDVAARLDGRLATAEARLDGAIAHHGLVRYDAYNEMSGRQSTSIALLDATRSGVVLSSILHRDQARLYAKIIRDGEADLALSPEESEAVDAAMADDVRTRGTLLEETEAARPSVVVRRRGRRDDAADSDR